MLEVVTVEYTFQGYISTLSASWSAVRVDYKLFMKFPGRFR